MISPETVQVVAEVRGALDRVESDEDLLIVSEVVSCLATLLRSRQNATNAVRGAQNILTQSMARLEKLKR